MSSPKPATLEESLLALEEIEAHLHQTLKLLNQIRRLSPRADIPYICEDNMRRVQEIRSDMDDLRIRMGLPSINECHGIDVSAEG